MPSVSIRSIVGVVEGIVRGPSLASEGRTWGVVKQVRLLRTADCSARASLLSLDDKVAHVPFSFTATYSPFVSLQRKHDKIQFEGHAGETSVRRGKVIARARQKTRTF